MKKTDSFKNITFNRTLRNVENKKRADYGGMNSSQLLNEANEIEFSLTLRHPFHVFVSACHITTSISIIFCALVN